MYQRLKFEFPLPLFAQMGLSLFLAYLIYFEVQSHQEMGHKIAPSLLSIFLKFHSPLPFYGESTALQQNGKFYMKC